MVMTILLATIMVTAISGLSGASIILHSQTPYNEISLEDDVLTFTHSKGQARVFWGLSLPERASPKPCGENGRCLDFGLAQLSVQEHRHCQRITWKTVRLGQLKDCVAIDGHWYGGGEQISQPWPIEKVPRSETPYVTSDMLQNRERWYGGVTEAYWISTQGVALRVEEVTPLFLSLPDDDADGVADSLCLRGARESPFSTDPHLPITLDYYLCSGDNVRKVHEETYGAFFQLPGGIPDARMFEDPVWSTWAEYKEDINEGRVREFALGIKQRDFNHSQIEIDDNWETCYGELNFNPERFPNPKKLIEDLHQDGFRVTLWIHPFVNENCDSFQEGDKNGYFIQDSTGNTQKTSWWQGSKAGLIDFTNPKTVEWWTGKLRQLKESTGIDSFKFDAGETSWMPKQYALKEDKLLWPNVFTKRFVEAISGFGGMIEARLGRGTQNHPVFIRMLDKDSVWSDDNGLKTLVPSLLHFGITGYPFVLPDMIGGNSYVQQPSEELFLRWAQANTFMPAMQFSILPWRYGDKMTERCKRVTSLHKEVAPLLIQLAKEAAITGVPIARPTWWLCTESEMCLTADQQFLLGNKMLIVPVTQEGTTTLEVVIPPGSWKRRETGESFQGPNIITLHDINLDSIIYLTKEEDKDEL